MAVDLELLAAGDAKFLLDGAATDESQVNGEADDAMIGVWESLETQGGGGEAQEAAAAWWDLTLKQDPGLQANPVEKEPRSDSDLGPVELLLEEQTPSYDAFTEASQPPAASISPVSIEVKQTLNTDVLAPKRQVKVCDDSQESDVSVKNKPIASSMVTRSARNANRNNSSASAKLAVKREPVQNVSVKKEVKEKLKVRMKKKSAVGKSGALSPREKEAVKSETALTPLEIRRKRNRESMQRARRRQRDDIERMRGTLEQLENHYQELNEKAQARRRRLNNNDDTDRESMTLEADYYALADLSHTLKEEKFLLEKRLVDKQKTHRRLQQVMVDRQQELELPCPLSTNDSSLYSDFEYMPMTEDQVNEHIRLCFQQMRLMEETGKPFMPHYDLSEVDAEDGSPCSPCSPGASCSSTSSSAGECPFPPSATFGWEVRNETTPAGDFYVSFSKSFTGITPQEAMVGSWTRNAQPKSTPFRRHLRFEVLQVVNDSTYINGLDIEHPVKQDKIMRMIFLNFRMQTEKGFVIGRHSVNPTSPEVRSMAEQDSSFEYVDSSNWVEFVAATDEKTGEPGCRVKFIARTEYNTQEDVYVRLVNAISRTMLWELAVVPKSSLSLLPS